MPEIGRGEAAARLQGAQALQDVPRHGVVLAERVAPGDDEHGVRPSKAKRPEAKGCHASRGLGTRSTRTASRNMVDTMVHKPQSS
jgi:hypothetical protein